MTLESAIKHCEDVADYDCFTDDQRKCSEEHRQLADWLRELKERREKAQLSGEDATFDLISRQAAIDLLKQMRKDGDMIPWEGKDVFARIRKLPSAESEIIRCRNCKFASGDSRICMQFGHSPIGELDFCAWAERRTDEE